MSGKNPDEPRVKRVGVGLTFVGLGIVGALFVAVGKDLGPFDILAAIVGLAFGIGLPVAVIKGGRRGIGQRLGGVSVVLIAGLASVLRFAPTFLQLAVLSFVIGFFSALTYLVLAED
jgi:hypothetical protein